MKRTLIIVACVIACGVMVFAARQWVQIRSSRWIRARDHETGKQFPWAKYRPRDGRTAILKRAQDEAPLPEVETRLTYPKLHDIAVQHSPFREWLLDISRNDQEFIEWRHAALRLLWELKEPTVVAEVSNRLLDWAEAMDATKRDSKSIARQIYRENKFIAHEIRLYTAHYVLFADGAGKEALDVIRRVEPEEWKKVLVDAIEHPPSANAQQNTPAKRAMCEALAANAEKLLEIAAGETLPSSE